MFPLQQFINFIKSNALFVEQDKNLLAVSGGKDSVLMCQLFKLAGYQFSIAHCNFNLRGDESQRDESFVKQLAATLAVPFYVKHFDTKAYANEQHISTQMAARDLRYQWFEELRTEKKYDFIAVAHHQNDSIETLLLNLTRGTGISGLHGILPKRDKIVRPLLFLSRLQIDEIVNENNIEYVEDSSNETSTYARNKIRLNIIPQLREINPNLEETFALNIARFAETEQVLWQAVESIRNLLVTVENDNTSIPIAGIKRLLPQNLLLYELLKPYHFSNTVVKEIIESLNKQSGTSFYSATHRATINRAHLLITTIKKQASNEKQCLIHSKDQISSIDGCVISISFTNSHLLEANRNKAFVDFDKLIFPLVIRYKQNGDRFIPLGMRNYKKLSDFLIDSKVSLPEKERIPLLINGNGEIIWVAGFRQDNRYKLTITTKKVVIFELLK